MNTPFKIMRDQRGITGLETAIIMISFVVVASAPGLVLSATAGSGAYFAGKGTASTQ